jgi:hypothetical protein
LAIADLTEINGDGISEKSTDSQLASTGAKLAVRNTGKGFLDVLTASLPSDFSAGIAYSL